MPNGQGSIDEVIGQQAIDQVAKFEAAMKKLADQMTDTLSIANQLNSATGLKSVQQGVQGINTAITKTKEYTLTIAAQAVEQSRVRSEMKLTAKQMSDNAGSYTNLDAAQQRAAKSARDAGIQFGVQSEQFKKLSATSNEYLGRLRAVDEALGNSRRNVGNYQGAVFSMSQVIRELPAFTYSAQQGFLAIGNNMPILIDQFKLLREQVGSTGKAIGIFARSIFSFVNVFTILTGLFTIFYKDIMMFVRGTDEGASGLSRWTDNAQQARKEMYHLTNSLDLVKKGVKDKNEFLKEYNDTLGKVLGNTKELNVAENNTLDKANLYIDYIVMRDEAEQLLNKTLAKRKVIENLDATSWVTMAKAQFGYAQSQYAQSAKAGGGGKAGGYAGIGAFFSGLFNTEDSFEWYKQQAMKEGDEATKAWVEMEKKLADFKKVNGFTDGLEKDKDKDKKAKEVNRIEELRKQYEMERMLLENMHLQGKISTAEYLSELMKLDETWAKKKMDTIVNLSKAEKQERVKLENEILKNIEENFRKLEELSETIKRALKQAAQGNVEGASDNINANAQQYIQTLNALLGELKVGSGKVNFGTDHTETIRKLKELLDEFLQFYSSISSAISDISAISFQNEMSRLDAKDKRLKSYYENERRFIEQSGFSALQKGKMQQKLDAETEAKKKQIDRDRITALRKQAALQKALDIVSIIGNTAKAVTELLATPYLAIAAGLAGAAQLARVIATPLPQYARGRKGGKQEWAVVGEAGQEAIVHNGRVELTPNQPTVTLLPEGADVIPNHELIKNAAYVKLSKQGAVTTDKLQAALIESYERNTTELRNIKQVLIDKKFLSEHKDLSGYEAYRKTKVQ